MYKKKYIPNCLIKNPQAKILVIRYGGIGDVLWTTPAIRAIKEQYPLTKIKYCVSEKDREILYNNPYIDGVIATKFPRVSDLEWADFVLDFFDSVEENEEAKVKDPIDISCDWVGLQPSSYLPVYVMQNYEKEWAKMFLSSMGYKKENILIGMPLTASSMNRTWLGYHELIDVLLKTYKDLQIILLGNLPHGESITQKIHNTIEKSDRIIDVYGRTTLRQSFAIYNECNLIFSPDTGAVPVCASLGKKVLAMYSTVPKETRIKYYPTVKGIQADVDCNPCYKLWDCEKKYKCMNSISVYSVFSELSKLIEEVKSEKEIRI